MAGASGFAIVRTGGGYAARPIAARVEKASNSSDLRNERRDAPHDSHERYAGARAQRMSRYETEARAPLWNAPVLRAPFVAQVLGQYLTDASRPMPAQSQAAYRAADRTSLGRLLPRLHDTAA